ncbi:unnamed protein product [Chrysodeixis includens]|uniref:Uncharacterized protein n=1 Tax=Chrysodeixis includens TaxID=689277 RepID=A0A9N8KPW5_CHRIL|nr:unnamed protein product [Chrysodeixis includens]
MKNVYARHAARVALLERHSAKLHDDMRSIAREAEHRSVEHTKLVPYTLLYHQSLAQASVARVHFYYCAVSTTTTTSFYYYYYYYLLLAFTTTIYIYILYVYIYTIRLSSITAACNMT